MSTYQFDVVVIGSGFAGSLAAAILATQGRSVLLVESGSHPRFAIGESSTPLADFKLASLAQRYGLAKLAALTNYGRWVQEHPQVMRGVKRGFSYFAHTPDHPFVTDSQFVNELLVTANASLEAADTHWLRSDVDALFLEVAMERGVTYLDRTSLQCREHRNDLELTLCSRDEMRSVHTDFVIVATGNAKLWQDSLAIRDTALQPRTNTRAVFAHFADVTPWAKILEDRGYDRSAYPFPCDQAALHHVFDGGWMWQLRFDDQSVSAGFVIDNQRHPLQQACSPAAEWQNWLARFPSIANQFRGSHVVRPADGLRLIPRLQQRLRQVTGPNWALLPAAVGFADPLFSTGIAHALFAVDRLTQILLKTDDERDREPALAEYESSILLEIDVIDRMISWAYRNMRHFPDFVVATMPYFAAATSCERAARLHSDEATTMLLAENSQFLSALMALEAELDCEGKSQVGSIDFDREAAAAHWLRPFNQVGLLAEPDQRLYWHTSAKSPR